jgi:hypothetical protein
MLEGEEHPRDDTSVRARMNVKAKTNTNAPTLNVFSESVITEKENSHTQCLLRICVYKEGGLSPIPYTLK